jgi:hypothetical protein
MTIGIQWSLPIILIGCWAQIALAVEGVPARVVSVAADHTTLLQEMNGSKKWTLPGSDVLKIAGRYFDEGDLVTVAGEPPAAGANVTIRAAPVAVWPRIITIVVSGLVLLGLAAYASDWRPHRFLVGVDERVSNSKCQAVLWFGAAMTVYLATLVLRLIESNSELVGGIAIPANVLAMTGLSGLTFAGAKMIAVTKNDGNLQLQEHVSLPDVDGSLLAAFGVGQGAYLAKKAALPVGTG